MIPAPAEPAGQDIRAVIGKADTVLSVFIHCCSH